MYTGFFLLFCRFIVIFVSVSEKDSRRAFASTVGTEKRRVFSVNCARGRSWTWCVIIMDDYLASSSVSSPVQLKSVGVTREKRRALI